MAFFWFKVQIRKSALNYHHSIQITVEPSNKGPSEIRTTSLRDSKHDPSMPVARGGSGGCTHWTPPFNRVYIHEFIWYMCRPHLLNCKKNPLEPPLTRGWLRACPVRPLFGGSTVYIAMGLQPDKGDIVTVGHRMSIWMVRGNVWYKRLLVLLIKFSLPPLHSWYPSTITTASCWHHIMLSCCLEIWTVGMQKYQTPHPFWWLWAGWSELSMPTTTNQPFICCTVLS